MTAIIAFHIFHKHSAVIEALVIRSPDVYLLWNREPFPRIVNWPLPCYIQVKGKGVSRPPYEDN